MNKIPLNITVTTVTIYAFPAEDCCDGLPNGITYRKNIMVKFSAMKLNTFSPSVT